MKQKEIVVFPRSFSLLEQYLRGGDYHPEVLMKWADYLLAYQLDGNERQKSVSRRFYEKYGPMIAGPCGCSELFFDHQRIYVPEEYQKELVFQISEMYKEGFFPQTKPSVLARMIKTAYHVKYIESSLAAMIRLNL